MANSFINKLIRAFSCCAPTRSTDRDDYIEAGEIILKDERCVIKPIAVQNIKSHLDKQ